MTEYETLVETASTLHRVQQQLFEENKAFMSPACVMVWHAKRHVLDLATEELRGAA